MIVHFVCSGLANSEHSHPAGLLLKTSILLQHDGSSERLNHGELVCVCVCVRVCVCVCSVYLLLCMHTFVYMYAYIVYACIHALLLLPHAAFEDTLKHPDLSIEMALATIRLTTQSNRLVFPIYS